MKQIIKREGKLERKGFSLIEMLVSVAILGLLVGGGVAAYSRAARRNVLVQSGTKFESIIRDVQKKAQSTVKPERCVVAGERLEGWSVVQVNSREFTIGAECNGYLLEDQYSLDDGTLFSAWPGGKIKFEAMTGRMINGSELMVIITDDEGFYEYQVVINEAGGVSGEVIN